MNGQKFIRLLGVVFWILAILIFMATYGVLAKPLLVSELNKGFFERESMYHDVSFVLSILLLTTGTFLIVYPFKKSK